MSNTLKLLERVRERTETKSNYAVYSALGVQAGVFKRWTEGTGYPGNAAAFKIAEILEMDAKAIIALIEEDKAESKEARAYWRSLCPENVRAALAGATSIALMSAAVFAVFAPSHAEAAAVLLAYPQYILCLIAVMVVVGSWSTSRNKDLHAVAA